MREWKNKNKKDDDFDLLFAAGVFDRPKKKDRFDFNIWGEKKKDKKDTEKNKFW